jgi:hypothetical protein
MRGSKTRGGFLRHESPEREVQTFEVGEHEWSSGRDVFLL